MENSLINQVPVCEVGLFVICRILWDFVFELDRDESTLHLHFKWTDDVFNGALYFRSCQSSPWDDPILLLEKLPANDALYYEL